MLEQQLATNSLEWLLLLSFCGSVFLVGQRALQLFLGYRLFKRSEWLNTGLATIVVAVLVVDGVPLIDLPKHLELSALLQVVIVTVALGMVWFHSRLAYRGQLAEARWRRTSILALLISSVTIAAWSSHRFYTTVMPSTVSDFPRAAIPGHKIPSTRYVAVTDRGREVPLFRWQVESDEDPKIIRSMMALLLGQIPTVIQRDEPDMRSNCHGWVFTRGRFLLSGECVEQVLEDNGYEVVTSPHAGDVVIYRNGHVIVHTGLVTGILSDGSVIVESKWSVGARFLHGPGDQPYSQKFAYYRTSRQSHSLAIRVQNRPYVADQDHADQWRQRKAVQLPIDLTGKTVVTDAG